MKILITGASGTGTSSLAKLIAEHYNIAWFDLDDFYWQPIEPKYTIKRTIEEREKLLANSINNSIDWVISGTLLYWGNFLLPLFDLVVFLTVPTSERIRRIIAREIDLFGEQALFSKNGTRKQLFENFIAWTQKYDYAHEINELDQLHDFWSRQLHEQWLLKLSCPILHIDGYQSNAKRLQMIIDKLNAIAVIIKEYSPLNTSEV